MYVSEYQFLYNSLAKKTKESPLQKHAKVLASHSGIVYELWFSLANSTGLNIRCAWKTPVIVHL